MKVKPENYFIVRICSIMSVLSVFPPTEVADFNTFTQVTKPMFCTKVCAESLFRTYAAYIGGFIRN